MKQRFCTTTGSNDGTTVNTLPVVTTGTVYTTTGFPTNGPCATGTTQMVYRQYYYTSLQFQPIEMYQVSYGKNVIDHLPRNKIPHWSNLIFLHNILNQNIEQWHIIL